MNNCPFCSIDKKRIVIKNDVCCSVYDNYSISKGHSLIILKQHVSNFFYLSSKQKYGMIDLLSEMEILLLKKYNPEGFNVGININKEAGQTIHHVHIHLIPRYKNDVKDPTGGVRNVIPGKGKYIL
jgi:diadenosine tetraphosphate (Ap4A) HIT family hydrolase